MSSDDPSPRRRIHHRWRRLLTRLRAGHIHSEFVFLDDPIKVQRAAHRALAPLAFPLVLKSERLPITQNQCYVLLRFVPPLVVPPFFPRWTCQRCEREQLPHERRLTYKQYYTQLCGRCWAVCMIEQPVFLTRW